MDKIEGYVVYDEKNGINYRRVYIDKTSANIAITERFEKIEIDLGKVKILPTSIVSYIDIRQNIRVKDKCPNCGGIGKIKEEVKKEFVLDKENVVDENLVKIKKKAKKEIEEISIKKTNTKMIICDACNGTKEIWKDVKAIVIY